MDTAPDITGPIIGVGAAAALTGVLYLIRLKPQLDAQSSTLDRYGSHHADHYKFQQEIAEKFASATATLVERDKFYGVQIAHLTERPTPIAARFKNSVASEARQRSI